MLQFSRRVRAEACPGNEGGDQGEDQAWEDSRAVLAAQVGDRGSDHEQGQARGVAIPVRPGSTSPSAPRASAVPIALTAAGLKSSTQVSPEAVRAVVAPDEALPC